MHCIHVRYLYKFCTPKHNHQINVLITQDGNLSIPFEWKNMFQYYYIV